MDAKTKEYYLYCGIKIGWHDKSLLDFTNDNEALLAVKKYLRKSKEVSKEGLGLYLWGANGTGKCLGKGTKVIKDDLSLIPVERVKIGDKLLRPDGKCNTVVALSHGVDKMYRVSSKGFMSYNVNSKHVLSLKFMVDDSTFSYKKGEVLNIPIEDFLGKPSAFRELFGGWKPNLVQSYGPRVGSIFIEDVGVGEYYGFELDGDHLFLLEDFTVTHNSHLMNSSFKELIAKGHKVRIYSMDEIVDKFTSSWYSDEDKKELDNVLRNIDFLGIDEFGKNVDKDGNPVYLPDLVKRVMESVIRFRVQMNRPIWFASNTDPKFVRDVFSEDIASLLREAVVPICVRGEDFRREIQRRNKRKFLER